MARAESPDRTPGHGTLPKRKTGPPRSLVPQRQASSRRHTTPSHRCLADHHVVTTPPSLGQNRDVTSTKLDATPHAIWASIAPETLLAAAQAAGHTLDADQLRAVAALGAGHQRGVYLHGAVGRGKSWLADQLLAAVNAPKRRLHVHGFLAELSRHMARERLPLPEAVKAMLGDAHFLLLDEFHVHDIADAIMLRRTVTTLLSMDVAVLMTSNYPPQRLLPDPTFHEAVLPAIEAILTHLDVVELGGDHDYRSQSAHGAGFASGTWTARPSATQNALPDAAAQGPGVQVALSGTRVLRAIAADGDLLRVHWDVLCASPVSVNDYLTLAQRFSRWELEGVPAPEQMEAEPFQRLAYLLDVLVDADLALHVEAATDRAAFAAATNLPRDANRLLSRLSMLA